MLPIEDALPALKLALAARPNAVLVAPPGAGKSTRVPLALVEEPWVEGRKIIVLAPRRIAARAAAARMADNLGEPLGRAVGYRVRMESRISRETRIEVVTEGVFTRQILADPALDGIAAVLFDEFHERSLDADLGLALALDAQAGLRPDLRLLVMSATIEASPVAAMLGGAPIVTSEGRSHPIETRYLGRDPRSPIEPQMADAIAFALRETDGDVLAFLPGGREIRRTARLLAERALGTDVTVLPLHGALEPREQDLALKPAQRGRRKVILATSIAETSLTIEGVCVVVDSGLARVPRYEPGLGLTTLVTERASRASVDQRRGRAGRTAPGRCFRLWDEPETRALKAQATPEILEADLATLRLALADWGVSDARRLSWLDPPPLAALAEADTLLRSLGALDETGRLTEHGVALARLPLPPRLAHMILAAARNGDGPLAARIALILSERDLGGDDLDLRARLDAFATTRGARAEAARSLAARWLRSAEIEDGPIDRSRAGVVLALAFPDRIAKARPGPAGEFLLANGRGAMLEPTSPLARERFLAVASLAGDAARQRILLAAPITDVEIERDFASRIELSDEIAFDPATRSVRARRQRRLGALVLSESTGATVEPARAADLLIEGLRASGIDGLRWSAATLALRARAAFMRALDEDAWPDLGDTALLKSLNDWLAPYLDGALSFDAITPELLDAAIKALLPYELRRRLDDAAPTHLNLPSGLRLAIDYESPAGPTIAAKVQDLFGLTSHPMIGQGKVALVIELLSPARRPVQVTRDLPGFWAGSYQAVRAAMRGRYPKHAWPEDPRTAPPVPRRR